jgi:hypothetical protein
VFTLSFRPMGAEMPITLNMWRSMICPHTIGNSKHINNMLKICPISFRHRRQSDCLGTRNFGAAANDGSGTAQQRHMMVAAHDGRCA